MFEKKLRDELEADGFVINLYDPCVANKMTEKGNQITVVWYVDDLMVPCKDNFAIIKFAFYLANIYRPKITMYTSDRHDYLGVIMDFKDQKVKVLMFDYLDKMIQEFPKAITGAAASPASDHLFKVRDEIEAKYLPEEQATSFHHFVTQLLFLVTQARRDISVAVSFLASRVK